MRQSCLLVLLLIAFVACVKGLDHNENSIEITKVKTTSFNGGRNLKGSPTTDDGNVATNDEERGAMNKIAEFFKGNLAKLFGTNSGVSKQVQTLQKDAKLINSIKSDSKLIRVAKAVEKNPGALNEQKLSKIGQFVENFKKIEYVGDVKGMRIAYGLLVLAIFGIAVTGYFITQNVRNSYIH